MSKQGLPCGSMWLLIWESHYGDEGEGRKYMGVWGSKAAAQRRANTWPRPDGYSPQGGYEVVSIFREPSMEQACASETRP